jgi:hypothetical protein
MQVTHRSTDEPRKGEYVDVEICDTSNGKGCLTQHDELRWLKIYIKKYHIICDALVRLLAWVFKRTVALHKAQGDESYSFSPRWCKVAGSTPGRLPARKPCRPVVVVDAGTLIVGVGVWCVGRAKRVP